MVPRIRAVFHNRKRRIVRLVVLGVEEHQLAPQVSLVCNLDELWQVASRPIQLEVFHQTLRAVLGEGYAHLRKYTHMRTLQTQCGLEEVDKLVKVALDFVGADQRRHILSVRHHS